MIAIPDFVKLTSSAIAEKARATANGDMDLTAVACAITATLVMLDSLDSTQLVCLLMGAAWYALMQPVKTSKFVATTSVPSPTVLGLASAPAQHKWLHNEHSTNRIRANAHARQTKETLVQAPTNEDKASVSKMPKRTLSFAPVRAPVFQTLAFESQVEELVQQIAPKPDDERAVQILTKYVQRLIQEHYPDVEVTGFVTGNFRRAQNYDVAVPEVDIVASISSASLVRSLKGGSTCDRPVTSRPWANLENQQLQKAAIRACTNTLVPSGGFRFRRSAFRSEEPKVTLLAPALVVGHPFAVGFSVNCITPLYNATLLTDCGRIDARAKELILLVKRWAKDRGICQIPYGHLHPYAWSLLAIYYLQVCTFEDGPLLPPLEMFEASSRLAAKRAGVAVAATRQASEKMVAAQDFSSEMQIASFAKVVSEAGGGSRTDVANGQPKPRTTTAMLLKGFFNFYNSQMNWRKERVSVRTGHRAPPDLSLDMHTIVHDDGRTQVAPCIEDPFNANRNLGFRLNALSHDRFLKELDRADKLCQSKASLTELLEPWEPPEQSSEPN